MAERLELVSDNFLFMETHSHLVRIPLPLLASQRALIAHPSSLHARLNSPHKDFEKVLTQNALRKSTSN